MDWVGHVSYLNDSLDVSHVYDDDYDDDDDDDDDDYVLFSVYFLYYSVFPVLNGDFE